ncbi:MAG: uroporphyrinogen-III synthase [Nevskia sp.]|nr:uroporphyrinogen-III synthase [Nevskia sp.]
MPEQPARLDGLTVLVARPAAQADALCALIEQAGGRVLRLPLFEIAPVADPAVAARQLQAARSFDRWLFTSSNAVRHAAELLPPPWPPLASVGAMTAATLAGFAGDNVLVPEDGDGAEALLRHPALQQIAGQRHLIVTGEQTLPRLEAGLRVRGAEVEVLAVYRRVAVEHAPERIAELLGQANFAIIPSGEALARLAALTPLAAQPRLQALQLAVPSPRVVETARILGFVHQPLLPQRVTDAAYLEVLSRHRPGHSPNA